MSSYFEYESVTSAKPLPNGVVAVTFRDGSQGCFDCKPYFNDDFWKPLRDETFFRQVYVEAGTLTWPNDIDIAPEEVWHNSVRVMR